MERRGKEKWETLELANWMGLSLVREIAVAAHETVTKKGKLLLDHFSLKKFANKSLQDTW